jgi:hypothetical protein
VQDEVLTISSKSESLELNIGSSDDEGDGEDIREQNSVKFLYQDSAWN